MSKKEEKRAIIRTAIWIAIICCMGSIAIGFAASLNFGFDAAPIIVSVPLLLPLIAPYPLYMLGKSERKRMAKNNLQQHRRTIKSNHVLFLQT